MGRFLHFLGDVWLPMPFKVEVPIPGDFILNLESPITNSTRAMPGKINLKVERNYLVETFGRPPIAVCLGNNHIMDYGPQGLRDTLTALNQSGIGYFGAGTLQENCHNPLIINSGEISTALLSYVCETSHPIYASQDQPGVIPIDFDKIRQDINNCRDNKAQRIIVSLHWGLEEVNLPRPKDITLAHKIIDCGADMIVGHHSHCIQRYEIYRNKYIFYGIGNCIFPYYCLDDKRFANCKRYTIPRSLNRKSLLITVDLLTMKPQISQMYFNDHKLMKLKSFTSTRQFHPGGWRYPQKFLRQARFSRGFLMFLRFFKNPKMIKLMHLRSLLGFDLSDHAKGGLDK